MTSTARVTDTAIRFTPKGETALNELATVLANQCSHTPEGVAKILSKVMHTDIDELTYALDDIAAALDRDNQ